MLLWTYLLTGLGYYLHGFKIGWYTWASKTLPYIKLSYIYRRRQHFFICGLFRLMILPSPHWAYLLALFSASPPQPHPPTYNADPFGRKAVVICSKKSHKTCSRPYAISSFWPNPNYTVPPHGPFLRLYQASSFRQLDEAFTRAPTTKLLTGPIAFLFPIPYSWYYSLLHQKRGLR